MGDGVMNVDTTQDERYFTLLSNALRVCSRYKPKFGRGGDQGLTLEQFQQIYGADPFYNWVGINSPLMYAAHKAAGGMTSVYRQLGIGCERIFRAILQDTLGLLDSQIIWSYQVPDSRGKLRNLSLDGRIDTGHIADEKTREKIQNWLEKAGEMLRIDQDNRKHIKGMVFEVRQGYKSKDSKRQHADVANAANAYASSYIPIIVMLSTQMDSDIALRYQQSRWLLLSGTLTGTDTTSTYVFLREILGYDLAAFFHRNSERIKAELEIVLTTLLQAS
jgi:hypothetical protein